MVERSLKPCGISGSAERGGCVTAELSTRTQGLVKRAQDHVNNGTSQAQTPGYRAVTVIPPASIRMTDTTCYEKLLSMSIQGSSLCPIIHTMGRVGNCHQLNACELKLLRISLSPLPASPAGASVSILHSNHLILTFFDSVQNPTFTTVHSCIVFHCCCAYSFPRSRQLVGIHPGFSAPLCLERAAAGASSRSVQG